MALGTVYVLHLNSPMPGRVQHYTGWTSHLPNRLFDHRGNGNAGAGVLRRAAARGIGWTLALTVDQATQADEKRAKNCARRACPLCDGDPAVLAAQVTGRVAVLPQVAISTRAERFATGRSVTSDPSRT